MRTKMEKNEAWNAFMHLHMLARHCIAETKENRRKSEFYFVFETIEASAVSERVQQALFNARLVLHIRTDGYSLFVCVRVCVRWVMEWVAGGRTVLVEAISYKIKELAVYPFQFIQLLRVYGFSGRYRSLGRTSYANYKTVVAGKRSHSNFYM